MSHEPECLRIVGKGAGPCICWLVRAAYRRGYADHAATAEWDVFQGPNTNQHGEGTNP